MHPDVVKAQATTLKDWADEWQQEAVVEGTEGAGEVSFLLRRAAAVALAVVGAAPPVAAEPSEPEPPVFAPVDELREG